MEIRDVDKHNLFQHAGKHPVEKIILKSTCTEQEVEELIGLITEMFPNIKEILQEQNTYTSTEVQKVGWFRKMLRKFTKRFLTSDI